jgi:hypothetical protein
MEIFSKAGGISMFEMIKMMQQVLNEKEFSYWVHQDLFSLQWWLIVVINALFLLLFYFFIDRHSAI